MGLTKIVKLDSSSFIADHLKEAAAILSSGGLVIIPTETVYGIAANMADVGAIERLYKIKGRPQDKPFSLHIDTKEKLEYFTKGVPVSAYKLIDKFWPGPLTLILKSKDQGTVGTSTALSADGERPSTTLRTALSERSESNGRSRTIGIRMPNDNIALGVIGLSGVPIVCPSANISGKPAPVNFEDAIKDLNGLVDFAIDAGPTKIGVESTVVDLTVVPAHILRGGAIKGEDIEAVIKKKVVLFICTGNTCRSIMAKALLEKTLRGKNRLDVEVLSAGIMMLDGLAATEEVKGLLGKEGIDVSAHRSQRVTRNMIRKSDIVLVMEELHEKRILQLAPEAKNRVFLLKEFAKINNNDLLDIPDPIGRPFEFYAQTFDLIKECVERITNLI